MSAAFLPVESASTEKQYAVATSVVVVKMFCLSVGVLNSNPLKDNILKCLR